MYRQKTNENSCIETPITSFAINRIVSGPLVPILMSPNLPKTSLSKGHPYSITRDPPVPSIQITESDEPISNGFRY